MFYVWKVWWLRNPLGNLCWRYWRAFRGDDVWLGLRNHHRIPEHIRRYAPGRSFADIGCIWAVNGEYSFLAEEAGATSVKGVDVVDPTPEFEAKRRARNSAVEFVLGDASDPATVARIGVTDVVFCAGVLYHHPSPFDLLVALRQICGQTLILRTSAIPEVGGLRNAAVYFPFLERNHRRMWNDGRGRKPSITEEFQPQVGYGNWFWGLSPSCLVALLQTAGFRIDRRVPEAFAQTFICSPVAPPFAHRLPDRVDKIAPLPAARPAEAVQPHLRPALMERRGG